MRADLVISGPQVFIEGQLRPASLVIAGGKIQDIVPLGAGPQDCPQEQSDRLILPGFVDTHVHINEPGRTQWEGFETATQAAAAGGVTCLVDMPLNCIPVTTTLAALEEKLAACENRLYVDCGFFGGVVPGNAHELEAMVDRGVLGFKSFLIHSGIDDFPKVEEEHLRAALPILKRRNIPYLIHAELEKTTDSAHHHNHGHADAGTNAYGSGGGRSVTQASAADSRRYLTFLESRPDRWETDAVDLMIRLSGEYGARVHIVHLSSAMALPALEDARRRGVLISVETCPHYLTLAAEDIPDGATEFKCAPPIRRRDNQQQLWRALQAGVVDFVVSDHSPCVPALKLREQGDFMEAWGGIASLQLGPANLWTGSRERSLALPDFVRWLCSGPAEFAGLHQRKGKLAKGFDADVVFWNPDEPFVPIGESLYQRHKLHPYADRTLTGLADKTFLRGELVFERMKDGSGRFVGPRGQQLLGRG